MSERGVFGKRPVFWAYTPAHHSSINIAGGFIILRRERNFLKKTEKSRREEERNTGKKRGKGNKKKKKKNSLAKKFNKKVCAFLTLCWFLTHSGNLVRTGIPVVR